MISRHSHFAGLFGPTPARGTPLTDHDRNNDNTTTNNTDASNNNTELISMLLNY